MEGEKGPGARLCPSPSCASAPAGPAPPGELPASAPPLPKSAVRLCMTCRGSGLKTRDSSQARSGRRAVDSGATWTKWRRSFCAQRAAREVGLQARTSLSATGARPRGMLSRAASLLCVCVLRVCGCVWVLCPPSPTPSCEPMTCRGHARRTRADSGFEQSC